MYFSTYSKLSRKQYRSIVLYGALFFLACSSCGDEANSEIVEKEFSGCPNAEAGFSEANGTWLSKYDGETNGSSRIGVFFSPGREFANFQILGCAFVVENKKGRLTRAFKIQMTIPNDAIDEFTLRPGLSIFPGKIYSLYSNYDLETADQDIYLVSHQSMGNATITNFDPLTKTIEGSFNVESLPFALEESDDQPINIETSFSLSW